MKANIELNNKTYSVDLGTGINISTVLSNSNKLKAFYAPDVKIEPLVARDFIGDIKQGSPVNFKNVMLNPHGNGTHTECLAHVHDIDWPIYKALPQSHFIADLISVVPTLQDKDYIIDSDQLKQANSEAQALIIRVNHTLTGDLSGTNPPYLTSSFMKKVLGLGYQHIVLELPSVDKEDDGGEVANHKLFFEIADTPNKYKTITELVDIPNTIKDGQYLLDIQIINLDMDASPSRLMLYPIES